MKLYGSLDPKRNVYFTPQEAFEARTETNEGGCLVWTGATNPNGYGQIRIDRKTTLVHRWAWEQANGPLPEGVVIDHLCWTPACARLDHLRAVVQSQNTQNRQHPRANSRSGIRGVCWDGRSSKWYVSVSVLGKRYSAGYFEDKEDAGRAAAELRAKHMPYSQN